MANKNYYYKPGKGKGVGKIIAATACALVIAAGACAVGVGTSGFKDWTFSKWFGESQVQQGEDKMDGNTVIGEGESSGISLQSAAIPVAAYDEYGIDLQAENAVVLTATITPAATTNKTVTWSTNDTSGKVKVTPVSDNPLQATVQVLGAFDKQVTITCTATSNSAAKATCTVDYVKSYAVSNENRTGAAMTQPLFTNSFDVKFGVGTLTPTSYKGDVVFEMNSDLYEYLHTKHSTVLKSKTIQEDTDFKNNGTIFFLNTELFGTSDSAKVQAIWDDIGTYYYGMSESINWATVSIKNVKFYYNDVLVSSSGESTVSTTKIWTSGVGDITVNASGVTLNNGSLIFGENGKV